MESFVFGTSFGFYFMYLLTVFRFSIQYQVRSWSLRYRSIFNDLSNRLEKYQVWIEEGRFYLDLEVSQVSLSGVKVWYPLEITGYNQSLVEISARWITVELKTQFLS